MANQNDEIWSFIVEWYDPLPQLTKQYLLKYFKQQNQVEMFDIKSKRLFLKKTPCPPEMSSQDFYFNAQIVLFSRDLKVVDYADPYTRSKLVNKLKETMVILPCSRVKDWGKMMSLLDDQDVFIVKLKSVIISSNDIFQALCTICDIKDKYQHIVSNSTPNLFIKLQSSDQSEVIINAVESISLKFSVPIFITQKVSEIASIEQFIFEDIVTNSSRMENCTCCIIKPHAVKSKNFGNILDDILNSGFQIFSMKSLNFTKSQAEEFLEVYRGVAPEYHDHVLQFISGTSIALELRAANPVTLFRQIAGPWDVEMAKALRPNTIRAKYGVDSVRNAIHCTDLEEDGISECEYCFTIMN